MNTIRILVLISLFMTVLIRPVWASWPSTSDASALPTFRELNIDERVETLKNVLKSYGSPLTSEAKNFVYYADKYGLDWKLVAAIAGVESTFGKRIPVHSFNAWGWAVYTGTQSGAVFENWEHGIATVSEGIRKNYIDKGADTPEEIGRMYAASRAWPQSVRFFINRIDNFNPASSRILAVEL